MPDPRAGLRVRVRQESPIRIDSEIACAPGELTVMGENTLISMWVGGDPEQRISLTVSNHVAERNFLATDAEISVSLLRQGVHLMANLQAAGDNAQESPIGQSFGRPESILRGRDSRAI